MDSDQIEAALSRIFEHDCIVTEIDPQADTEAYITIKAELTDLERGELLRCVEPLSRASMVLFEQRLVVVFQDIPPLDGKTLILQGSYISEHDDDELNFEYSRFEGFASLVKTQEQKEHLAAILAKFDDEETRKIESSLSEILNRLKQLPHGIVLQRAQTLSEGIADLNRFAACIQSDNFA